MQNIHPNRHWCIACEFLPNAIIYQIRFVCQVVRKDVYKRQVSIEFIELFGAQNPSKFLTVWQFVALKYVEIDIGGNDSPPFGYPTIFQPFCRDVACHVSVGNTPVSYTHLDNWTIPAHRQHNSQTRP